MFAFRFPIVTTSLILRLETMYGGEISKSQDPGSTLHPWEEPVNRELQQKALFKITGREDQFPERVSSGKGDKR
jgi:hypothetical protein